VIPSGTEAARPFLPTKDFDTSRAFYEALGFSKLLEGDVAHLRRGTERLHPPTLLPEGMGDELDDAVDGRRPCAWWAHIDALDLQGGSVSTHPERRQCNHGDCVWLMFTTRPACFGILPNDERTSQQTKRDYASSPHLG
jgi:hypothetical protein